MRYLGILLVVVGVILLVFSKRSGNSGDVEISVPEVVPAVHAGYLEYTSEVDFSTVSEDEDIILFFHADWCSSCNQIEKDILKKGVPEGLHIYKVDFDVYTDVLEKYNVLTQSSFTHIDRDGTLIKRRVGGFGIDDIIEKLNDTEQKPWEKMREQEAEKDALATGVMTDTSGDEMQIVTKTAYFAGGCFRCLEGPFEAMEGVKGAISGYLGGTADTATYRQVSGGKTKHREGVQVIYDPRVVSYEDLVQTYRYQIDPTDPGGQFADRGYHYTTAIYYETEEEKIFATASKNDLAASGKFDQPIAVLIEPFTTFFPAEDKHQDYYLKQSAHYNRYKKGSGRAGFIDDTWQEEKEVTKKKYTKNPTFSVGKEKEALTDLQRKVLFEEGTEPPFNNKYRDHKEAGIYVDVLDGTPLFSSTDKFDSGTGRPSFTTPIDLLVVGLEEDRSHGMVRTEVETANNTHLGHVFDDGPGGSKRYCINSAALDFVPLEKMEELGYGEYLVLFEKE